MKRGVSRICLKRWADIRGDVSTVSSGWTEEWGRSRNLLSLEFGPRIGKKFKNFRMQAWNHVLEDPECQDGQFEFSSEGDRKILRHSLVWDQALDAL